MYAASVQILIDCEERLLEDIRYFRGASSNKTLSDIDMTPFYYRYDGSIYL